MNHNMLYLINYSPTLTQDIHLKKKKISQEYGLDHHIQQWNSHQEMMNMELCILDVPWHGYKEKQMFVVFPALHLVISSWENWV